MNKLSSISFYSKYAFKTTSRVNKKIKYEGLLLEAPKDLLEQLESYPDEMKFIIIYE